VGNRTRRLTTRGALVERVEGTFDARDRLTQEQVYDAAMGGTLTNTLNYGYDANGSLTTRTATGGSLTQVWDVRGRLASATDVQGGTTRQALYGYDPDGIRLREAVTTTTGGMSTTDVRLLVADHLSLAGYVELIEERTESGLIVASYVYGLGLDPISVLRAGQPVGLYVADGHSGVRQVVDLAVVAAVLAALRYDAFGNRVATAGTFSDVIGYRGERLDTVTGNINLRRRDYAPPTGRFTSMDSFVGFLEQPQSIHQFLYSQHDPINRIDPTGNVSFSIGGFFVSFSLGRYLAGVGVSYAIGKVIQATTLLLSDGNLARFRWLEWWDLLSLIPGAVWGGLATYAFRPATYLTKAVVNGVNSAVGKLYAQLPKLISDFTTHFAATGGMVMKDRLGNLVKLAVGNSKKGFQHIVERHIMTYYKGTKPAITTLFPPNITASEMMTLLKEAVGKYTAVSGGQVIKLSNGMTVQLVIHTGEVITFYPITGPGVAKLTDLLKLL
jgi:RHS repeat-associated protein